MKRKTLNTQENTTDRRHEKVRECAGELPPHLVLHGGAIYGVNTPIREVKFHAGGIYIERTAYELFHGYILLSLMLFYPETKLQYP